jgi:hypothetical protein
MVWQLELNGVAVAGAGTSQTNTGPGPFTWSWVHESTGQTYALLITVTDNAGCTMTYVRYIQQQAPAGCTFLALDGTGGRPTSPPGPNAGTGSQPRPIVFDFLYTVAAGTNYAITNNQTTETMRLNLTSGAGSPFHSQMTLVWADVNGLHPELQLESVDFLKMNSAGTQVGSTLNIAVGTALAHCPLTAAVTAAQTTFSVSSGTNLGAAGATGIAYIDSEAVRYTVNSATQLTVVRGANSTTAAAHVNASDVEKQMTSVITLPPTMADIAATESLRFKLNFRYDSSHKSSTLTTSGSAIRDLCLSYKVDSDPTATQNCNLVRPTGVTTANPSSCD